MCREAGLTVNDTSLIHIKQNEFTNESHYLVLSQDNAPNTHIPIKLDGIFLYFLMRALTTEYIENCEDMLKLELTPDTAQWDPYNKNFAEAEDRFLDLRGDLINRPAKGHKILDNEGVFELQVSEERYEAASSSIVAENVNCVTVDEDKKECANPQDGDFDFIRDDHYMQVGIADLTACFGGEFLQQAVTDR